MFAKRVRGRLLSGIAVLVPVGVTLFALRFILGAVSGLTDPLAARWLEELPWLARALVSLGIVVVVLYVIGEIATHVIGRRVIDATEQVLLRIPLVRPIYSATKQVLDVFGGPRGAEIQSVVLVEFPAPGTRAVGFLTGEVQVRDETWLKVFVPTTPNPTTGFLQLYPEASVWKSGMSVEEGIRMVMSMGVLAPAELRPVTGP